ncbi:MAG: hypothetical protein HFJ91_10195 [Muribaculaceae bacterium]|nr:hypothetical protein [Muribaculaceae bacterium]
MTLFASRPTVYVRPSATETSAWESLFNTYTKDDMRDFLEALDGLFDANKFILNNHKDLNEEYFSLLKKYRGVKKGELVLFLSRFFSSPETRNIYFNSWPEKMRMLWSIILDKVYITTNEAKEYYGAPVTTSEGGRSSYAYSYSYQPPKLCPELKLLTMSIGGYWTSHRMYISMPRLIRQTFGPLIRPTTPEIVTVADPQVNDGEKLFSSELQTLTLMPVMQTLYNNGKLQKGRYKVTATTLRLQAKALPFDEFFPASTDKALKNLRGTLCSTLYCDNMLNNKGGKVMTPQPPHEAVREIAGMIRSSTSIIYPLLCDLNLSKCHHAMLSYETFSQLADNVITALTTHAAGEEWLTTDGFINYFRSNPDRLMSLLPLNFMEMQEYTFSNNFSGLTVYPNNEIHTVGIPFAMSILAIFASLGIVEIIYATALPKTLKVNTPFEAIRFVRLTPLGRYALKLTDSYTPAISDSDPYFELDSERLLIRALRDNNPYEVFLKDYAESAGGRRYKVTPASFLEGCDNVRDITYREEQLRRLVGVDFPPVWDNFFKELTERASSIKPCDTRYYVFDVNPDDIGLQTLLTDDPELRSITRCAEGYVLLIPMREYDRFKERMKSYGYLL